MNRDQRESIRENVLGTADKENRQDGRISTTISPEIKENWRQFLFSKYGSVKFVYGREVEAALKTYMLVNTASPSKPIKQRVSRNKLLELQRISNALEKLPSYPLVTPLLIETTIRRYTLATSGRTHKRYYSIVLKNIEQIRDNPIQYNVEPFVNSTKLLVMEKGLY